MKVELYPHQVEALRNTSNGKIVSGGVGTGKSRVALAYYFTGVICGKLEINGTGEAQSPTKSIPLYVITTAKKRDDYDWEGEAANFGITDDPNESLGGNTITVDSWNNIVRYTDVQDAFFIFDEQRLVGSGAWVKAFYKIAAANQWIVLSATPGDNWMDFAPIFIANKFYANITQFKTQHVEYEYGSKFPKIKRYHEEKRLERIRDRLLVAMPYERHTVRHKQDIIVGYDEIAFDKVWKKRWNVFTEEPIRDIAEMFGVARKVVNSDPRRLNGVMQLMEKHPRLIIFYNFNYELEMLRTLGPIFNIPVAEWNGHKHQPVPTTEKWLYLVQYTAGSEGWNCITTDAMVFYSMNYSWKVWEQAHGRIDRLNTKYIDLYYYTLRSASKIDQAISKALKLKRNFNERQFAKPWEPFAPPAEEDAQAA